MERAVLDDGDALYAVAAQQMVERGDWVTPYANGVRFLDKPPMMYWLMGASYLLLGTTEFAARLPTVLAVLATGVLLFLAARDVGRPAAGVVSALAFVLCVGTFLFTRMVFPDMLFVLMMTATIYAFLRWHADAASPVVPALAFYTALAGAVLTKGLIGIVFPLAIVVAALAWSRELARLKRFHMLKGTALFLALAVPWHVLAAKRNPGFLWYYFVNEQVLRFLGRRQPFDYESISLPVFWLLILVWFFPWSVFLPAAFPVVRESVSRNAGERFLVRMSLGWIVVVLGFFTFSSRIEHYSLPLLPPLAMLAGLTLSGASLNGPASGRRKERRLARAFGFLGLLGALAGLAAAAGLLTWGLGAWGDARGSAGAARHLHAYSYYFAPIFDLPPQTVDRLRPPLLGTCLALFAGMAGAWWLNRRGRRTAAVSAIALMMAAFCLFAYQSIGICEEAISSRQFGRVLSRLERPGDALIVAGDFETANSINFYSRIPLEIYGGTAALLEWGLRYPDAPRRMVTRLELESRWAGSARIFLLVPDPRIDELRLGRGHEILRSAGRTLFCNQAVSR
jgi:4-amino-4-deoxy-L-arabinose transferase-like glycosyltransferase